MEKSAVHNVHRHRPGLVCWLITQMIHKIPSDQPNVMEIFLESIGRLTQNLQPGEAANLFTQVRRSVVFLNPLCYIIY